MLGFWRWAVLAGLLGVASVAGAALPFVNAGVVLLQPEATLQARIADAGGFASYMLAVEMAAGRAVEGSFQRTPAGGFLVLAIRPPARPRVWLDLDAPWPEATAKALRAAIEAVPAPQVADTVVVSLKVSFWGGRPTSRVAPVPQAWREHARQTGQRLPIEQLVEAVWDAP